jgi:hypothetical protein
VTWIFKSALLDWQAPHFRHHNEFNFFEKLVGVRGFEPPTPSSRTRCATRLRYTPTWGRKLGPSRKSCLLIATAPASGKGSLWENLTKRAPASLH